MTESIFLEKEMCKWRMIDSMTVRDAGMHRAIPFSLSRAEPELGAQEAVNVKDAPLSAEEPQCNPLAHDKRDSYGGSFLRAVAAVNAEICSWLASYVGAALALTALFEHRSQSLDDHIPVIFLNLTLTAIITLFMFLLILSLHFVLVVFHKIKNGQNIRACWSELFPETLQKTTILEMNADDALERTVGAISKEHAVARFSYIDLQEYALVMNLAGSHKLFIKIDQISSSSSTVSLSFRSVRRDFWHYSNLCDFGTRQAFLDRVEKRIRSDWKPHNALSKLKIYRSPLNKVQAITLLLSILVPAGLLSGPDLIRNFRLSELRARNSYVGQMNWQSRRALVASELDLNVNEARELRSQLDLARCLGSKGGFELFSGFLNDAEKDFLSARSALRASTDVMKPDSRERLDAWMIGSLTEIAIKQGKFDHASKLISELCNLYEATPSIVNRRRLHFLKGLHELAQGHEPAAEIELRQADHMDAAPLLNAILMKKHDQTSRIERTCFSANQPIYGGFEKPFQPVLPVIPLYLLSVTLLPLTFRFYSRKSVERREAALASTFKTAQNEPDRTVC